MADTAELLATARQEAKGRAKQIRGHLGSIHEHIQAIPALVAEAWEAKDHELLGYDSWAEYLRKEYETHLLKIARPTRRVWIEEFKRLGMDQRAISAVVNASQATVSRDSSESAKPAAKAPASGEARAETKAMRQWAVAQGMDVSSRGRLPARICEAYEQTHLVYPAPEPIEPAPDDDEIVEAEIVPDASEQLSDDQRAIVASMQRAIDGATPGQCRALAGELMALATHAEARGHGD
jgi:hypothetical protein